MAAGPGSAPRAPAVVERLVKQLYITLKAVRLYPPSSHIPRENAAEAVGILRTILKSRSDVRFLVLKEGLRYEGLVVFPDQPAYTEFAQEFYNRNLAEIRFHAGASEKEIIDFLALLKIAPADLQTAGGFEARLWDLQVDGITVREVSTRILDAPDAGEAGTAVAAEPTPEVTDVDAVIAAALGGSPRDQRVLVRVMRDRDALAATLVRDPAGRGAVPLDRTVASRVTALAHVVGLELPDRHAELYHDLGEAVMALDPALRDSLLRDRLLPDARSDETIAEIIRSIGLDELCEALVEGLAGDAVSREGLSRALRNLALISLAGRDTVISSARTALEAQGADEAFVAQTLEGVTPSVLRVSRPERATEERPAESIFKLVDMAPSGRTIEVGGDVELERLVDEVGRGVSDADVLAGLVTLATIETRPTEFANIMSLLEDDLALLLEWGEFGVAADAAEALSYAEKDERLESAQRTRIRQAIGTLAVAKQMRIVSSALRVYPSDSVEYQACKRLVSTLGGHAIDPLLEVLAAEPDMTARKGLVDLLSDMALQFIPELGGRVSDDRWFFVRNVVAILGATRDSEVLQHLNRTLRYRDPRVRRETIRALAGIRDRLAEEMLVAALSDDDAQNVQLAARYLGSLRVRGSITSLHDVARGEGRGNRDVPVRVEAVEALGRIGDPASVPVLRELLQQRALLRSGRAREVRAAAEAALATMAAPPAAGSEGGA